ncbi:MAG: PDZ domain-containing protein [Deltaproteobacteria bacterium]|nr:PDZ domain-containing protein [Deltaproteobacteria bacterium]
MKAYFTIANILLVTCLSYFGVDLFYKAATSRIVTATHMSTADAAAPSAEKETLSPLSEYGNIQERNLFNIDTKKRAKAVAEKVEIADLKKTELKLKLWGTVTGEKQESYAVIEDTRLRRQMLYRVDDAIQNALIKEIHREKVILDVDGTLEVLEMEKVKSGPPSRRSGVPLQRQAGGGGQTNITLKREKIENAVNDLNSLMKNVRIRPHFKDGQPDGLSISGIRSRSIFSEMGLRNGDVIIGVDGNKIESVDDALKLYESLQSATGVQVQIRRRGQLRDIDYRIE